MTKMFETFFWLCVLINLASGLNIINKLKKTYNKFNSKVHKLLGEEGNLIDGIRSIIYNQHPELKMEYFEYPGTNETLREINRANWQDYYECLKQKYVEAGTKKTVYPYVLMAFAGASLRLECSSCISPATMYTSEIVEWYYDNGDESGNDKKSVEPGEHTLITADDISLQLYNVQPEQSGRYWCALGHSIGAPYFLHVDNGSELTRMVRPNDAPHADHALEPTIISRYNLKVYSTWTDWTSCSTCDKVGKKMKYGYCTISLLDKSTLEHVFQLNKTQTIISWNKTDIGGKNVEGGNSIAIRTLLKTVLSTFRNKIPCRSRYTPEEIQNIEEIKERKSEIMVRFCKITCLKNVIFEVRDRSGKVLESSNNSAGIYSMIQGVPEAPPSVTRITLYEKHDEKATMKCPGNLNTDTPVVWQIGHKVVNPLLIAEQSHDRIYINMKNQLTIKKLRFADENIYSCWQNRELAGTIQLKVTREIESKINHHILLIGAVIIVSLFLYIFFKAYQGRNRYTKH